MPNLDDHKKTKAQLIEELEAARRRMVEFSAANDTTQRKRNEEQLWLTQFAIDRADDAALWIGPDGGLLYVNDATCRLLGYTRQELLNMTISDIDLDYPAEKWQDEWQVLKQVESAQLESTHRKKDGTQIPVWLYCNLLEFEGKEINCVFARDLSERKRDEERLRFTQFAIDRAPEATFWLGADARFFYVNDAACSLHGYSREELLTKHVVDISPEYPPEVWPQHWQRLKEQGSLIFESHHRRKDGSRFLVELTVNYLEFEGEEYCCAYVRDITERKRYEEQLRLTQFAIDRAGDAAVWMEIPSTRLVYVNDAACRNLGYSREELLAMKISDLSSKDRADEVVREWNNIQSPGGFTFETLHRRKDGTAFPVEVSVSSVSFKDADYLAGEYWCAYIRDISERKRAEEEKDRMEARIQQTQKLESLGVLAGGIAHDFNNLLTGILGNATLAQMELGPSSAVEEKVKQIEQAALQAADLTQQMLAYSGKGRFLVEPIQINDLIREMTLLETVMSKKAVLNYSLVEDLPAVEADATQIRQVIMNLLTNASDAVELEGGIIQVTTGVMEADREYLTETYLDEPLPEGRYVYLEVTDTGVGMDAETRARIFDPFFTTKFAGRGLGLAAVLGIVRGHRGAIKMTSEPGQGTTIRLLLPATEQRVKPQERDAPGSEEWQGSGTLLVVDDEETVRLLAKSMLTRFGFDILTARDGHEAVEVYRDHAEEIIGVLLDMTMPQMDGEATLRELRRFNSKVPVLLMSGYNEEEFAGRFASDGATSFLHKPFRAHALIAKLREALAVV